MYLTDQERELFDLLIAIVNKKSPDTVLRVAGGWPRDKIFNISNHDIDIAVSNMSGYQFALLIQEYIGECSLGLFYPNISVIKSNPEQSKHLETANMNILGMSIDFANLRKESYANSRIPEIEQGTPEEDASRRDLTINSLFYNLNTGKIEDYMGGMDDLNNLIARTPLCPLNTFLDDPLRMLRTIRFASKYNLKVLPEIITSANNEAVIKGFRNKISAERIWKELAGQDTPDGWKPGFLTGPNPARSLKLLKDFGLRDVIFGLSEEEQLKLNIDKGMLSFDSDQKSPHHDLTIWAHTVKVVDYLANDFEFNTLTTDYEDRLVRVLGAVFHDIGKCDMCSVQIYAESHPEYNSKVQKLLENFGLVHTGELRSYKGHEDSSAKITEHILNRLKAPLNIINRVVLLVENHMRPHAMIDGISAKGIRKYLKTLGKDWSNSMRLAIADAHGKIVIDPDLRDKYLLLMSRMEDSIEQMHGNTTQKLPISGKDLINLGYKQGPIIGKLLKLIEETVLDNPDLTKEEALELIKGK